MRRACAIASAVLLFLIGCSITMPYRPTPDVRPVYQSTSQCPVLPADAQKSIRFDVIKSMERAACYRVLFSYRERDTGDAKNDIIRGEFFHCSSVPPRVSLVLLIPGTGENVSTQGSAEELMKHGFDVVRLRSGIRIFDLQKLRTISALHELQLREFSRAGAMVIENRVCDIAHILDHFVSQFEYHEIGVSGVSLGGIFAPLIKQVRPRVSSVLIMISGGDIAGILRTSTEGKIIETRDMVRSKFIGSEGRMWEIISEELRPIDPQYAALELDVHKTLIIANYWDRVIDYRYAGALWKNAGKPDFELILFPPGHYGSALMLWVPIVRWHLVGRCPLCVPIPLRLSTVRGINVQFFNKTLPHND